MGFPEVSGKLLELSRKARSDGGTYISGVPHISASAFSKTMSSSRLQDRENLDTAQHPLQLTP